jgi:hypothetical protein
MQKGGEIIMSENKNLRQDKDINPSVNKIAETKKFNKVHILWGIPFVCIDLLIAYLIKSNYIYPPMIPVLEIMAVANSLLYICYFIYTIHSFYKKK